jgi:hypothetical protein
VAQFLEWFRLSVRPRVLRVTGQAALRRNREYIEIAEPLWLVEHRENMGSLGWGNRGAARLNMN